MLREVHLADSSSSSWGWFAPSSDNMTPSIDPHEMSEIFPKICQSPSNNKSHKLIKRKDASWSFKTFPESLQTIHWSVDAFRVVSDDPHYPYAEYHVTVHHSNYQTQPHNTRDLCGWFRHSNLRAFIKRLGRCPDLQTFPQTTRAWQDVEQHSKWIYRLESQYLEIKAKKMEHFFRTFLNECTSYEILDLLWTSVAA